MPIRNPFLLYLTLLSVLMLMGCGGMPDFQMPVYQRLTDEQAALMADEAITAARAHKDQGEWQQAREKLSATLDSLPRDSVSRNKVSEEYQILLEERDNYIALQRLRLNVKQARYLLQEGKYLEKIHAADPLSINTNWELSSYRRKSREIGEFLARQGSKAMDNGKYYSARRYLDLSQKLLPNEETATMLARANKKIAAFKYLAKKEQEDNYRQLMNRYKMLKSAEDYSIAKEVLDTLLEIKPDNRQLLAERTSLHGSIALAVNQAVLDGEARYSIGEVQEALLIWKQAADLAPENIDLQQRIERAERFLQNYQSLQGEQ